MSARNKLSSVCSLFLEGRDEQGRIWEWPALVAHAQAKIEALKTRARTNEARTTARDGHL